VKERPKKKKIIVLPIFGKQLQPIYNVIRKKTTMFLTYFKNRLSSKGTVGSIGDKGEH
jgi:hypothetical protein